MGIYTKFVTLIASTPSVRTLIPFSASEITQKGDEVFQLTSEHGQFGVEREDLGAAEPQDFPNDMIFEHDPIQIVNSILPLYLNGQILRTLQESVASNLLLVCNLCKVLPIMLVNWLRNYPWNITVLVKLRLLKKFWRLLLVPWLWSKLNLF